MAAGEVDGDVVCTPGEILVVSLPMQFDCDTVVQPGQPMLALSVEPMSAEVADVLTRLLRVLGDAEAARAFSTTAMARDAGMSVSGFHEAFKRVPGHAPLQYLKLTRLHMARDCLSMQDVGAAEAAYGVGYGSTSQFSRECKRLFGVPPSAARAQPVLPA